jgi:hypothetical protein
MSRQSGIAQQFRKVGGVGAFFEGRRNFFFPPCLNPETGLWLGGTRQHYPRSS